MSKLCVKNPKMLHAPISIQMVLEMLILNKLFYCDIILNHASKRKTTEQKHS